MSQYRRDADTRLSFSDSSNDEHDLSSSKGAHVYLSDEDSDNVEDGGEDAKIWTRNHLDWSHTSTNSLTMESDSKESEDEAAWRLNNTSWYVLVVERYCWC